MTQVRTGLLFSTSHREILAILRQLDFGLTNTGAT